MPLIVELFGDQGKSRKKNIVDTVTQIHRDRGGLDVNSKYVNQEIGKALGYLKTDGFAENICRGYWIIFKTSQKTREAYE